MRRTASRHTLSDEDLALIRGQLAVAAAAERAVYDLLEAHSQRLGVALSIDTRNGLGRIRAGVSQLRAMVGPEPQHIPPAPS